MANVRAKFTLTSIKQHANMTGMTYEFTPQYDTSIPEDQRFAKYSPSGLFTMFVDNPAVSFALGQAYYVDFSPVPEAAVVAGS